MGFLRYSVLALRVLAWVVVASLAVFAVATAFGFAYERDKALRHAHANAQEVVEQSLAAVSASLWQYDVAGLNALLDGMVASRVVVRVEVLGPDKLVLDVRQPGFTGSIDNVWTTPVVAQDRKTTIGTLRISESYADANSQTTDTLKILVMTDMVKIAGLALVLFAIVYRKIAKHLHQLAMDVTRLGHSGESTTLSVRRKHRGSYRDEIDILVDAINSFVSERKLANEAQRIAATAFDSQQGMIISDSQRVILRVNKAFSQITGYSAEEVIGKNPRILQSGLQDATFYKAMWDSILATGSWQGEIWNRRKSGEAYPEWISISAVRGDDGVVCNYVATFTDITHRKTAQDTIERLVSTP